MYSILLCDLKACKFSEKGVLFLYAPAPNSVSH
jgi:hypothetical protein